MAPLWRRIIDRLLAYDKPSGIPREEKNLGTSESVARPVTLARLKVSPPHIVYDLLRDFHEADKAAGFRFDTRGIDEMERALLARNVPLIDLGLARYGRSPKVVGQLFRRPPTERDDADVVRAVRLGCLGNPMEPVSYFSSSGGLTLEELEAIAIDGNDEEAQELLRNPALGDRLAKLYTRKAPVDSIPDERFAGLVQTSADNPRISIDEGNEHGPDMLGYDIQRGILNLVLTVPVEEHWLNILHSMLMRIDPAHTCTPSEEQAREALSRWAPLKIKKGNNEPDSDQDGYYTALTLVEEFRCLVAALYGRWWEKGKSATLGDHTSEDVVVRCAFYGNAASNELAPKTVQAAVTRDSGVFSFAALWNNSVLLDKGLRATLESHLFKDLEWVYARRCKQLAERYRWFDPRPVSDDVDTPEATTHTLASLATDLARIEAKVAASATATTNNAAPAWFYWVVIALLVYIAFRR